MPTRPYQFPNLLNLTPLAASGNSIAVNLATTQHASYGTIVHVKFTLGSLTNAQVVAQLLNPDGSTWQDLYVAGALVATTLMAASANQALYLPAFGCKQFRCRYTSTGTVTSSALIIDATQWDIL